LESDLDNPNDYNEKMLLILSVIANAKGWTIDQAANITYENAKQFYNNS
jgi:Tat protein secretion system quality control protein TatD with DNase activity